MLKRIFDTIGSFLAIGILFIVGIITLILAAVTTSTNGIFVQKRVGQYGKLFTIYKLRTMHPRTGEISKIGTFLRKTKLDELPQLINILKGEMSFVGPRPDIQGYYDKLEGEARKLLELKPGLTSEAALKYANEEQILKLQEEPLQYNNEVLFPDKVQLNLTYYYNQSFWGDLKIMFKTVFAVFK